MGRYGKVYSRIWLNGWDQDTRYLALYLLTNHHSNILGCYLLPKAYIMADLKWTAKQLGKPFGELLAEQFIQYDDNSSLILITHSLEYDPIENENQAKAAAKILDDLPKSPLFSDLKLLVEQLGKPFLKPLLEQLGKPIPKPVTVTDTEENTCAIDTLNDKIRWEKYETWYNLGLPKIDSKTAKQKWEKIKLEELDDVIRGTRNYLLDNKGNEKRFLKRPVTFLNRETWRDFLDWKEPDKEDTIVRPPTYTIDGEGTSKALVDLHLSNGRIRRISEYEYETFNDNPEPTTEQIKQAKEQVKEVSDPEAARKFKELAAKVGGSMSIPGEVEAAVEKERSNKIWENVNE